ncbi:MAG: diguanylate cyclase [Rhizobacter sp.]|nr:diguanylate cyclase [Chlorobiales bacterium]
MNTSGDNQGIFKNISDEVEGVINVRKYKPEPVSKSVKVNLEKIPDLEPSEPKPENAGTSVEEEFSSVVSEILTAIKETMQARTAAFCWSSGAKKKFFIAARHSDSPDFTREKWLPFASDVLTQIFLAGNAQLYTEISAADETKLIRYYAEPNGIRSFMGVPVFHQASVYGILFVDSIAKEAYSPEDVKLLNRFGKICSSLIENYAVKSAHLEELKFVQPAIELSHRLFAAPEVDEVIETFCRMLAEAIEVDHLALALVNSKSELVIRKVMTVSNYVAEGGKIDLSQSLAGAAVMRGEHGTIDDLSLLQEPVRFFAGDVLPAESGKNGDDGNENVAPKGSLLIVPVKIGEETAGVLTLESGLRRYFNRENFAKVRFFTESLASALQTMLLKDELRRQSISDEETGTLSKRAFAGRMRNEINRATRESGDLSLMMIEFDDQTGLTTRYGKQGTSILMRSTARLIGANIRSYDLLARFGHLKFAVGLFGISEINSRFWAEKIREQIVNFPFETEDEFKTILASVSIGIARLRADKPDIDLLFEGAEAALGHAMQSGGNTIKVY